ncbi:MAG: DUF1987 domain-containing protein [Bacteroidia bacterium]|nr:DUF1987 domain-containing protein [Bacteroidia bacterium]
MKPLIIESTYKAPKIILDPDSNLFEISGKSRPENVTEFYEQIFNWFYSFHKELISQNKKDGFILKIYIVYFNSSSAKYILNLLKILGRFISDGIPVRIDWCFDEEDEVMKEMGEDMASLSQVPFNYITMSSNQ